ncbi:MAG TPA: protein-methionine-sulfoxide reductase heme-binding subunit MsrQ [Myxococcales bacterium]|nr:protein-methionine-sulfoxide reductase heme-binding subunit MsrQ [Myxococcales bacterium]
MLGGLGADPVGEVLNRLGLYTLSILLGSLACTPLQIVFGWKWPLRVRRMVGLWAFAYASLHLVTYTAIDQSFDFTAIGKDIVKRQFITVGFAAFVVLLALAVTTPQRMVRKLGFRWWKRLHRLVYVAGVLGCIHFLWRFKLKEPQPIAYGVVLLALLGIRAIDWARKRTHAARILASPPPARSV